MSQATESTVGTSTGQVLEFDLGEEAYCVAIDHVTEVVDMADVTPVPNAPSHVEGVMDLRGNTTTIIDPKKLLNISADGEEHRIIVFDSGLFEDNRSVGWVVDEVREVHQVSAERVDDLPVDDEHVEGVIKRDSGFVVWVRPRELHA